MSCIISQSGKLIDVLNPKPGDFNIEDIAAGLIIGKTERYGSRTLNQPYYVAEHSVHVAQLVAKRIDDLGVSSGPGKLAEDIVKAALLHDAAEAYLGDIVQPLKACLPDYKTIESSFERAIAERFGFANHLFSGADVKHADRDLFQVELAMVASDSTCLYGVSLEYNLGRVQNLLEELPVLRDMGWTRARAYREFLQLCDTLNIK